MRSDEGRISGLISDKNKYEKLLEAIAQGNLKFEVVETPLGYFLALDVPDDFIDEK